MKQMKQMKKNKYLSFGCFIFNYFSKINFSSRVCILVILSSLFLPFCAGGSEDPGTKVVDPGTKVVDPGTKVVDPPPGGPETITKVGVQSYFCTNGVKKDPVNLAVASASTPDKQGCASCDRHYRVASGSFLDDGSTCVARTCAVEGEEPCSTCYAGSVRSGHTSDGLPTSVPSESTCVQVDSDNNKLIDITTLTQLHNMRYNLAGTSYKTDASTVAGECGTYGDADGIYEIASDSCIGYELMNDLNFDSDDQDDDSTYTPSTTGGVTTYILDNDDNAAPYFVVTGVTDNGVTSYSGGWDPIDDFATTFNGNDNTITGLAISRGDSDDTRIGMFGTITADAMIHNINLNYNLSEYTGSATDDVQIGGLVGFSLGTITTSSVIDGKVRSPALAGGLVGFQQGKKINASIGIATVSGSIAGGLVGQSMDSQIATSYATGDVNGGTGDNKLGGLVGQSINSKIRISYATGAVIGGAGADHLGGLVGESENSQIITSYATGAVTGGAGADRLGGLVGESINSQIIASHATIGAITSEAGANYLGGLVGNFEVLNKANNNKKGIIVASYATGAVAGGIGTDGLGGLVGQIWITGDTTVSNPRPVSEVIVTVIASYATGNLMGGDASDNLGGLVGYVDDNSSEKVTITASYATGAITGEGGQDTLGGLVGYFGDKSSVVLTKAHITASYANNVELTDDTDPLQHLGSLVGNLSNGNVQITDSYGFATLEGGTNPQIATFANEVGDLVAVGVTPSGVSAAADLTLTTAITTVTDASDTNAISRKDTTLGEIWNKAKLNTLGAWFFETGVAPTLKFNDYDGPVVGTTGDVYSCSPSDNYFTITIGSNTIDTMRSCGGSITQ